MPRAKRSRTVESCHSPSLEDFGSALDLVVQPLEEIGRAQFGLVGGGESDVGHDVRRAEANAFCRRAQ
jgi:hypothetical protein